MFFAVAKKQARANAFALVPMSLAACLLSACGGGGGGDGAGNTEITPTTPVTITRDNAKTLLVNAYPFFEVGRLVDRIEQYFVIGTPPPTSKSGSCGGTASYVAATTQVVVNNFCDATMTNAYTLSGTVTYTGGMPYHESSSSLTIKKPGGTTTYTMTDFAFSDNWVLVSGTKDETLAGNFFDPSMGYATVSNASITMSGGSYPISGSWVASSGGVKARLSVVSASSYSIEIDTGAGYTAIGTYYW